MAQNLTYDLDSIGGSGGMGGFGYGNNPLLWLVTLAFLKNNDNGLLGGNGGGGAGVAALANANSNGETQAKLDCLQQQHQQLSNQLAEQSIGGKFATLGAEVSNVASTMRDIAAVQANQLNDFRAEAAKCCCDTQKEIIEVKTDLAMQTATLQAEGLKNTQSILDKIDQNQLALKDAEIRRLQDQLQTQTILANCHTPQQQLGDINIIARALQGQAQAQGAQGAPAAQVA